MKKIFFIILTTVTLHATVEAQNPSLFLRGNLSLGTNYTTLDYNGFDISYSPGGGFGLDIGLQTELTENLNLRASLGYQLVVALQAESVNGYTNSSSATFNRKVLGLGLVKGIELDSRSLTHFLIGGGLQYNAPGRLSRTENTDSLGKISYKSSFGFYLEAGVAIRLSREMSLEPSLRYRSISFSGEDYTGGSFESLPAELQTLNASGIELGFTLVKALK
ncbi:MAG: outer membrane beta-barrel protein [Cyclobacteriaceae bacterium]